jgi:hypothetical protein
VYPIYWTCGLARRLESAGSGNGGVGVAGTKVQARSATSTN